MIYLLRHCAAEGQEKNADLTEEGLENARKIVPVLKKLNIDMIYSSPMKRALETIEPFSLSENKSIQIDSRLSDRVLTSEYLDDFLVSLEQTFDNYDLKFKDGESSREALLRATEFLNNLNDKENTLIVSHGNLIALLLNEFGHFTFQDWKELENPDLWKVSRDKGIEKIDLDFF